MSPMTIVSAFVLGIALYSRYMASSSSKAADTYRSMYAWHFALTCAAMVMLFIGSLAKILPQNVALAFGGTGLVLLAFTLITQISGHGVGRKPLPKALTDRLPESWLYQKAEHPAVVAERAAKAQAEQAATNNATATAHGAGPGHDAGQIVDLTHTENADSSSATTKKD